MLQPKGQGLKPSAYGCAHQCPTRQQPKEPSRLERQLTMTLPQVLGDLPKTCDVETKRNVKDHTTSWIGYKSRSLRWYGQGCQTARSGAPRLAVRTFL